MKKNFMNLPNSAKEVIDTLSPMNAWEDKYRQLILWGKALPKMAQDKQTDASLISGCEAKVWLHAAQIEGVWSFEIDSNTRVVRGLVVLVLAAFNHQNSDEILNFNLTEYFEAVGLISQLSQSRSNGLHAIVEAIKAHVN